MWGKILLGFLLLKHCTTSLSNKPFPLTLSGRDDNPTIWVNLHCNVPPSAGYKLRCPEVFQRAWGNQYAGEKDQETSSCLQHCPQLTPGISSWKSELWLMLLDTELTLPGPPLCLCRAAMGKKISELDCVLPTGSRYEED